MLLITRLSAARRGNAAAASVAEEAAGPLGDRRVVLAILQVDLADRLPSPLATSQIGRLTPELIDAGPPRQRPVLGQPA